MAIREAINRCLIEVFRVSRIPIDPTGTVCQGDLMVWDDTHKLAVLATAASAGLFMGMSETTNPIETIGSHQFIADPTSPRINLIQKGLVELILGESVTVKPYDKVTVGANAQTVVVSGATAQNMVGYIDPSYGAAGKAVTSGTLVKVWLLPQTGMALA